MNLDSEKLNNNVILDELSNFNVEGSYYNNIMKRARNIKINHDYKSKTYKISYTIDRVVATIILIWSTYNEYLLINTYIKNLVKCSIKTDILYFYHQLKTEKKPKIHHH